MIRSKMAARGASSGMKSLRRKSACGLSVLNGSNESVASDAEAGEARLHIVACVCLKKLLAQRPMSTHAARPKSTHTGSVCFILSLTRV